MKNQPLKDKRKCRGATSTDPKVSPKQRVREFSGEKLMDRLFCYACREQLSLKRSIIANHIRSAKHTASKQKFGIQGKTAEGYCTNVA